MNSYLLKKGLKFILLLLAIFMAFSTLYFTRKLASIIKVEEQKRMDNWARANEVITSSNGDNDLTFYLDILQSNKSIPVLIENDIGEITSRNIDSTKANDTAYLKKLKSKFIEQNKPIEFEVISGTKNTIYYGNSEMLILLKYFPYLQLLLSLVFLLMAYSAFSYFRKNEQNRVWVGMARETAHQLGTPISSLMGWLEVLKDEQPTAYGEMSRDIGRLGLISERFSKIGSAVALKEHSLNNVLNNGINYMRKRTPKSVTYNYTPAEKDCKILLNKSLFDWVLENLINNATDAMKGEGEIYISTHIKDKKVIIKVRDTGGGIHKNLFKTVFKPGYTSKKRGWGLGLSLTKRIIQNYHKGKIYVSDSVVSEGTTFCIELDEI